MANVSQFENLRQALSHPKSLITDPSQFSDFDHDATKLSSTLSAVLIAESISDLQTAVRFCHANNIPVTPRGAGTGLSGGCVPTPHALVISTTRLSHIEIDRTRELAFCGPGVITKQLQDEAALVGLTYPPDPASYAESTLGGNVAEGAGGLRCKRFGVTKDYVLGMLVVTPDGELLRTGCYNNEAGFCIGDVLISSEGTLGIIVELCLQLVPIPERGTTILAAFPSPEGAARTVTEINEAGIVPTVMEFLDGAAATASNKYEQTEGLDYAEAILLFETGVGVDDQESKIADLCRKNSANFVRIESEREKADQLWKVRRNLSKAIKSSAAVWLSEDVAVPNTRFAELVRFTASLNDQSPVRVLSFGHAGDGNLHAVFLADNTEPATLADLNQKVALLMKKTLQMNGTLTGEHGIGLAKKSFLSQEFDSTTLSFMKSMKTLFDRTLILNPDKIFDDIRDKESL